MGACQDVVLSVSDRWTITSFRMRVPCKYPKPWCGVAKGEIEGQQWVIMVEGRTETDAVQQVKRRVAEMEES